MVDNSAVRAIRLDGLAYGGDYNPDQWSEDTWDEDVRLMRSAGVTMVSLPVFSWPRIEKAPGEFNFEWLDRVIDLLWSHGIKVDLATATATPPAWLVRMHPEILPQNRDGVRLEFGSRQAYCPSSPVFRKHALQMASAMAERYGNHEALAMWHISNEYGDHVSRCWCPESARHFRRWLQARYGSIDELNAAWGTSCWGQHYIEWDHIEPPRLATGPINPAQQLDFERFSSDALLELFRAEVDLLHELTPDIAVTTNFMSLLRDLDYWEFAAIEDIVTDDAYPDPADPIAHVPAALNYGLMRSLKGGQPWLLLEQAPSAVSWRDVNVPKAPGQMRLDSFQAIAHGSDGAMFFQWRQAKFGPEKYHSAMLGHRGTTSRTFQEASAFGAELPRISAVKGCRVRSSIAIVIDWDSWWSSSAPDSLPSLRLNWLEQVRAWHDALFALGHAVDTVRADGPLSDYRLVIAPQLTVTTPEQAAALTDYVAGGGHLVVGPFSGVVDRNEQVHDGGAPGPLRELLQIEVDEWWPVPDDETRTISFIGESVTAAHWTEWLVTRPGTRTLAHYSGGPLDGRPAITCNHHRDGIAWYVSAALQPEGLVRVLSSVLEEAELPFRSTPNHDLEVVTRSNGVTDYTFVLNHGAQSATVNVPTGAREMLTDTLPDDSITVAPHGVVVLEHEWAKEAPFLTISTNHDPRGNL